MSDDETKTGMDPETRLKRKAAQAIAFETWKQDWRRDHPKASREERKAAWDAVRGEEIKKGRRAIAALERGGFRVVRAPEADAG